MLVPDELLELLQEGLTPEGQHAIRAVSANRCVTLAAESAVILPRLHEDDLLAVGAGLHVRFDLPAPRGRVIAAVVPRVMRVARADQKRHGITMRIEPMLTLAAAAGEKLAMTAAAAEVSTL